jgi:tetrahydromethanopterin S-methyltransferase subunit G
VAVASRNGAHRRAPGQAPLPAEWRLEQRLQAMERRLEHRLQELARRMAEVQVIVQGSGGPGLSARLQVVEAKVLAAEGEARGAARRAALIGTLAGAALGLLAPLVLHGG